VVGVTGLIWMPELGYYVFSAYSPDSANPTIAAKLQCSRESALDFSRAKSCARSRTKPVCVGPAAQVISAAPSCAAPTAGVMLQVYLHVVRVL
jgi:hypothetical protein